MRALRKEFQNRGPWITGFEIDGKRYGGAYHAERDDRLAKFFDLFPEPGRVLELGFLEGGHTFPIAKVADEVVAIDSRECNRRRAEWLRDTVYRQRNITFLEANLEQFDYAPLGGFDVVFNVGLLYHLPNPWAALARLATVAPAMYLWTHVAPDQLSGAERGGYGGMAYEEMGVEDPLSGMSSTSFWPTVDELVRMLEDHGFADCRILDEDFTHRHGPSILLVCRSARFVEAEGADAPSQEAPPISEVIAPDRIG